MKKLSLILLALLALACNKEKNPEPKDSIEFKSAKTLTFDNKGGDKTVSFTTSGAWMSSTSAEWITLSPSSGKEGAAMPVISVSENTGRLARKGFAYITCGKVQDTVTVSQTAKSFITADPSVFSVGNAGGVYLSTVSANVDYNMQLNPSSASSWIKADLGQADSRGDRALMITVSKNDDVHAREAKIEFVSSGLSAEIGVSQSGQAPIFDVTAVSELNCPPEGKTISITVTTNLELTVTTPSWITSTKTNQGYDFTVSENSTDNLRSGTVTISNTEFNKKAVFSVKQKSTQSIYILAIGNSFSDDAMEYLFQILQDLGYKDIFLGNLYIGGCTLQTHAGNLTNNLGAYDYRTNSAGKWSTAANHTAGSALKERDWDYVSMQQASGYSGVADSYDPYLTTIVNAVKSSCPNAKRMWHMTWAYQGDSNHSDFPKYNDDQMTMYEAILNAVNTKVLSRGDFDFVIPSGTAVQNLRTSFLGDNLTRDGYHMSYNIGRYLTALMWARKITGKSIAGVSFKPSSYTYTDSQIAVIKDAVEKAYEKPYEVTTSSNPLVPVLPTDELKQAFVNAGYDLSQYEAVPLILTNKAYYNSTSNLVSVKTSATAGSTADNISQFAATQIFKKASIPAGSVIVLKDGFQYRPEGWTSLRSKNSDSARPKNTTTSIVVVDDAWWGSWNYRAFNLAKSGNPGLTDAEQETLRSCFAIFVPK
jgi:hypothetical protein